jgi:AbrB family looped-hinge helix DNA binding protein
MVAPNSETTKLGKRGVVVIPAALRRRFGLAEGTLLIAEGTAEGVLLRPAVAMPVEAYSPERKAEFLLSNAVDAPDYAWARQEVLAMGLDPDQVPHTPPGVTGHK